MTTITGLEPRLSTTSRQSGKLRLTLPKLATLLEVLPPYSVSLHVVEEALRSESFYVRYGAAKLLHKRGDRDARLVMQRVLTDGDAPSRASVARHLFGFSWYAAEPLIRQALRDTDVRVREGAIYALCSSYEAAAYALMATVLQNEADSVRMAAAWGLRDCQDTAAIPALEAVLLADDPEVRVKALEVMGANGLAAAVPVIRKSLEDDDPEVIYAAALSLLEIEGNEGLRELLGLIERRAGLAREAILRGLFHATNYLKMSLTQRVTRDEALQALQMALEDEFAATRLAAVWPLAWMHDPEAEAALEAAMEREADAEVRLEMSRIRSGLRDE
ncbi:MAG: HEAT repeat domain-containing protein [Anaerolineae bacterium]|nr:HEAT repeat domain-containing protein [Anaerolineae bacterium]